MNSPQIAYVNNRILMDPRIRPVLDAHPQHNWKAYNLANTGFMRGMEACYNRTGTNLLPFKDTIVDMLNVRPPAYNSNFQDSLSDINDRRYFEVCAQRNDRPWFVLWSGGIDSTAIVTSILRNSTLAERENIYIACNKISVYENPRFFYDFIQPNFKIADSKHMIWSEVLNTHYIIDGEPADQLFSGSISQRLLYQNPNYLERNCRTDPDDLLKYLENCGGREFAEWLWENTMINIQSQDCPVETYHDFFWWCFYNYCWTVTKFRIKVHMHQLSPAVIKQYLTDYTPWFDTADYQQWSMNNNQRGVKYGNHQGEYKLAMKQYIHSLDHNDYYLMFKVKAQSKGRSYSVHANWFCMLDDYTHLSLDTDLDQIIELLPNHIRT